MLIGGFLVGFGVIWWLLICEEITSSQRLEIIRRTYHSPKLYNREALNAVSQEKHYWCIATMRDPYFLYQPYMIEGENNEQNQ